MEKELRRTVEAMDDRLSPSNNDIGEDTLFEEPISGKHLCVLLFFIIELMCDDEMIRVEFELTCFESIPRLSSNYKGLFIWGKNLTCPTRG